MRKENYIQNEKMTKGTSTAKKTNKNPGVDIEDACIIVETLKS